MSRKSNNSNQNFKIFKYDVKKYSFKYLNLEDEGLEIGLAGENEDEISFYDRNGNKTGTERLVDKDFEKKSSSSVVPKFELDSESSEEDDDYVGDETELEESKSFLNVSTKNLKLSKLSLDFFF